MNNQLNPFYFSISQCTNFLEIIKEKEEENELLIFCLKGNIEIKSGEKKLIESPSIVLFKKGEKFILNCSEDCNCRIIKFNEDSIPETYSCLYSSIIRYSNCKINSERSLKNIKGICEILENEFEQISSNFQLLNNLLASLIDVTFSEMNSSEIAKNINQINSHANPFIKLLQENFMHDESVFFYADKLNVSQRTLNNFTHKIFGKSVIELIENKKMVEAKKMLMTTDLSIAEIGYELGYHENSYFTRMFHKKTGITPSEFRMKMKIMSN